MLRITLTLAVAVSLAKGSADCQVPELNAVPVPDSLRTEVLEFITSYYTAFSDRDWERFRTHFWPGGTITTVWQPPGADEPQVAVMTVSDFIEQAPSGPGSREIFEERMLSAEVRARGGLAVVFAKYRARFGDPGDVSEWEGTDSFSLLRHGGEWRIVALTFEPEP